MMATTNVLVPCKLCRTKVPVGDLRRNKDGIFVCTTCFSHGYLASHDIADLTPERLKKQDTKKEVKPMIYEERVAYHCSNCKFSFTRPLGSSNKGCPYCNKEHTVQRRENAQELIRNVDEDYFG